MIFSLAAVTKPAAYIRDIRDIDGLLLEKSAKVYLIQELSRTMGSVKFHRQYLDFFRREFSTYSNFTADEKKEKDAAEQAFARYQSRGMDLDWRNARFSEINSREYEFGYGMDKLSIGEQLLYSLGLMLLQVSAYELDSRY